jgi:hypothetical protein
MKGAGRYRRRLDLDAFHRLCRFVRWAGPDLEARDVLRILSHAEGWSTVQIDRTAEKLGQELARRTLTPAQVVPAAVTENGTVAGRSGSEAAQGASAGRWGDRLTTGPRPVSRRPLPA